MNLHEIGKKWGTDKTSGNHSHKYFSYLHRYEKYFESKKDEKNNILEFGVLGGKSLKTWNEYFPSSNIIGVDINPQTQKPTSDASYERIEVIIGSQIDENVKNYILDKYKFLDIIIDDASHINELILKSFYLYWPLLRNDGIYIIEDVWYGNIINHGKGLWPGQQYNYPSEDIVYESKDSDFKNFILDNVEKITCDLDDVFSLHVYREVIILIKKTNT